MVIFVSPEGAWWMIALARGIRSLEWDGVCKVREFQVRRHCESASVASRALEDVQTHLLAINWASSG